MKKTLLLLLFASMLFFGCSTDDSELRGKISDLEQQVKQNAADIGKLQTDLETALAKSLTVTVTAVDGGNKLTFSDGTSIIVKDGAKGDQGEPGEPGSDATVTMEETDDSYIFTVGDKTYTIAKTVNLAIMLSKTDVKLDPGESITIPYTITGADANTRVYAIATGGYTAEVDEEKATLTITAPQDLPGSAYVVLSAVCNTTSATASQFIGFENGVIVMSGDARYVSCAGETLNFDYSANGDIEISIPDDCDWITVVKTKAAMEAGVASLAVAANSAYASRTAVVTFKCATSFVKVAVIQAPADLPADVKAYGVDMGEGYGWGNEGSHVTLRVPIHNVGPKGYAYSTKYDFTAMSEVTMECYVKFNHPLPWADNATGNWLNEIMGTPDYFSMRINHTNGNADTAPTKGKVNAQLPGGLELNSHEIVLNEWHHVALVFNKGLASLYVNGELHEQNTTSVTTVDLTKSNIGEGKYYDFFLGCYNQGRWLNGTMAEARLWSKARTAAELKANAAHLSTREDGLLAYWKLCGEGNQILTDYSGNGFDIEKLNANDYTATNVPVEFEQALDEKSAYGINMGEGYGGGNWGSHCVIQAPFGNFVASEAINLSSLSAATIECLFKVNSPMLAWADNGSSNWLNQIIGSADYFGMRANHANDANAPTQFKVNAQIPGRELNSQFVSPGVWYHAAVVVNNGTATLYINGVSQESGSCNATLDLTKSNVGSPYDKFNFGTYNGSRWLNGCLSEVRVWAVARTPEQLLANWAYLDVSSDKDGLLGYWRLRGTTDEEILKDYSGNGFNAVYLGDARPVATNVAVSND